MANKTPGEQQWEAERLRLGDNVLAHDNPVFGKDIPLIDPATVAAQLVAAGTAQLRELEDP